MTQTTSTLPFHLDPNAHANFAFVPFVATLLSGQKLPISKQRLSLTDPSELTQESVEALQDMIHQATMKFLFRDCGWSKTRFAAKDEEHFQRERLWDAPFWDDVSLQFSEQSIQTLLALYNLDVPLLQSTKTKRHNNTHPKTSSHRYKSNPTAEEEATAKTKAEEQEIRQHKRERQKNHKFLRDHPPQQNGDLLLHHLAFEQMRWRGRLGERLPPKTLIENPFNLWTGFFLFSPWEEGQLACLERLLQPDIAHLLPWLHHHWVRQWLHAEPQRWSSDLEHFAHFNRQQSALFQTWLTLNYEEEQWDQLCPLLMYYKQLFRSIQELDARRAWLNKQEHSLRHMERQEYRRTWADTLTPARALHHNYERARKIHPVDREAPQRLYLDCYERMNFAETLQQIEELLEHLIPTLG